MIAESSKPVLPGSAKNSIGPDPITAWSATRLGGLEIALHPGVLHELHVAEIRESLAAHLIAHQVVLHLQIEPGQVLDRSSRTRRWSAADRDPPGIARVLFRVRVQLWRGSTP